MKIVNVLPTMVLELRHLRVVQAIIREGGVTPAANRLYLTQPAVSHTLRDLEQRLGLRLFHRRNKRMVPTPEALRLLEAADQVLELVERAEHDLRQFREGKRGVLRIATQCYTCYHWLPRILGVFNQRFPDVDLQLVPEVASSTTEALLAHKIDVAIVHRDPQRGEIALEHLFHDEVVAIFAPQHRLAGRSWVGPKDFADERLLLHVPPDESLLLSSYLLPAGVRPERMSQLSLTQAIIETTKANLGISALARWMVAAELEQGTLACARLEPNGFKREWRAAVRRQHASSAPAREFIQLLKQQCADDVLART